jgi:hypothetical protein
MRSLVIRVFRRVGTGAGVETSNCDVAGSLRSGVVECNAGVQAESAEWLTAVHRGPNKHYECTIVCTNMDPSTILLLRYFSVCSPSYPRKGREGMLSLISHRVFNTPRGHPSKLKTCRIHHKLFTHSFLIGECCGVVHPSWQES